MKFSTRVVATAVATIATYYFVYWLPFALLLPSSWPGAIAGLGSLICAFVAGRYVWRHTAVIADGVVRSVIGGALVVGGIGFVAGFFGPMIIAPGANQGPLLGIFFTGPLGVLVGAVGGAMRWRMGRRSPS